jgi:hypothetical protein
MKHGRLVITSAKESWKAAEAAARRASALLTHNAALDEHHNSAGTGVIVVFVQAISS